MLLKKRELVLLIERSIAEQERFIESQRGNDNPQVQRMVEEAKGRRYAYWTVLDAMKGNPILLRIAAGV